MKANALIISTLILFAPCLSVADDFSIHLSIPREATVVNETVKVADIAQIILNQETAQQLKSDLAGITLFESLAVNQVKNLKGDEILSRISSAGIALNQIGYSIPTTVSIIRKGRKVTESEIKDALKKSLQDVSSEIDIKSILWQGDQLVPEGTSTVAIEKLGQLSQGRLPLKVEIKVNDKVETQFLATASVEDWRVLPVLSRNLARGALLTPQDITVTRVNMSKLPADIVYNSEELIGKRTKGNMSLGEAVRLSSLDVPPVITKGKRVTAKYNRGLLTATAYVTALEDGVKGAEIKVRNETSKKNLIGKIKNENEVEVRIDE
jgi:flagella basal body P-ring formation protein FlgA